MKIEDIIKELDHVTIIEFKNYLNEHLKEIFNIKNSNALIISNNSKQVKHCEICGYTMYKNSKTRNGVQKYICNKCKHASSQTTNTITYNSKLPFDVWKNIIDNLLDGLSIRRMAEENNISIPTSFNLRHKVLLGLNNI